MPHPRLGALALAASLCLSLSARAETQNGGAAILVDEYGVRVPYAIAPQPDSGALVLCGDSRNASIDLYVQRVDRHGRPQFGAGGTFVTALGGDGYMSSAIADGTGGILYAWEQLRGATGKGIYVQRVLANGSTAYASPGLLVCSASFDQTSPQLLLGTGGTYYVCWNDARANVASVSDFYIQRYTLAGTPQFVANGLLVNTATYRGYRYTWPQLASDFAGGALCAWTVNTGGVRAQRVSSAGVLQYTASGMPVGDVTVDDYATIAADGTGGLWAATVRSVGSVYTPYAHHLGPAGASVFAPAGVAIRSSVSGNTMSVNPVRNASGGCFFLCAPYWSTPSLGGVLALQELNSSGTQLRGATGQILTYNADDAILQDAGNAFLLGMTVYETIQGGRRQRVQRYGYDGTASFPGLGRVVGRADPVAQFNGMALTTNGAGLTYEAHPDPRFCNPALSIYQAFGQMFDQSGTPMWDDAEAPVLVSAADAPLDQGGAVRIAWEAGAGDSPATRVVRGYNGWRALGTAPAALARAARVSPTEGEPFTVGSTRYVYQANLYWEQVASLTASQLPSYALTLPTGQDSTALGFAEESFMVEAWDDSSHHWWSNVRAAHSVDNLAPVQPAPFTGQYGAGTAHLHWNPNAEADLAGYRLYRGSTLTFPPGPATLISAQADTGYADPAGSPAVYKLTAVDIHGNESPVATLLPMGTLGVTGSPVALRFELASRNPAQATATLRLALPTAARVRVTVLDAAGREVRELASGVHESGESTITWDGMTTHGRRAPSGLYFVRLENGAERRSLRVVLTQ